MGCAKIESKRSYAPIGLPVSEEAPVVDEEVAEVEEQEDVIPVIDYDNDYFEKRFAVDKTGKSDKKRKEKIIKELKDKGQIQKAEQPQVDAVEAEEAPVSLDDPIEQDNEADDKNSPGNLPFV